METIEIGKIIARGPDRFVITGYSKTRNAWRLEALQSADMSYSDFRKWRKRWGGLYLDETIKKGFQEI